MRLLATDSTIVELPFGNDAFKAEETVSLQRQVKVNGCQSSETKCQWERGALMASAIVHYLFDVVHV